MILTRRGYVWLSVGIPLALGITYGGGLGLGILGLGLWDLGVLGVALWQARQQRSQRVHVERLPLERLSIGRDNPVPIRVDGIPDIAVSLELRDSVPPGVTVSPETLRAEVGPGGSQTLTYAVRPLQRGHYDWGSLWVRQRHPRSLIWQQWQVPQGQTVAVYPDLIGLQQLRVQLALQASGSRAQRRSLALGTAFQELRVYRPGDDLRLVHWPATARHQRPVVRVMEPEPEQTLIVLLDRGRLMTAQVGGLQRFDWGLNALLALALTGLQGGDRVGVGVFDHQVSTWIPAQRGQAHLATLIAALTPIAPDFIEPDYGEAVRWVQRQQSRRALVVILTEIIDATASQDLLLGMQHLLPRCLPLCVALRDPLLDSYAQDRQHPYERAVALDLRHQRRTALARAQRQGSLVLDVAVTEVSQALVDTYVRLKQHHRL